MGRGASRLIDASVSRAPVDPVARERSRSMLDLLFLVAGCGFFVLAAGYAALCERL